MVCAPWWGCPWFLGGLDLRWASRAAAGKLGKFWRERNEDDDKRVRVSIRISWSPIGHIHTEVPRSSSARIPIPLYLAAGGRATRAAARECAAVFFTGVRGVGREIANGPPGRPREMEHQLIDEP